MEKYCLGFLFDDAGTRVVLIRKNKPKWQAGLLNGIGGKLGDTILDEKPLLAMHRETGQEIGTISGHDYLVVCYCAFNTESFDAARQCEEEPIEKVFVSQLKERYCIENVPILIEAALHKKLSNNLQVTLTYDAKPQEQWTRQLPTEQGTYWWWNGDQDSSPLHMNILYSATSGNCFASTGQYGWDTAKELECLGGWWLRLHEPEVPAT